MKEAESETCTKGVGNVYERSMERAAKVVARGVECVWGEWPNGKNGKDQMPDGARAQNDRLGEGADGVERKGTGWNRGFGVRWGGQKSHLRGGLARGSCMTDLRTGRVIR